MSAPFRPELSGPIKVSIGAEFPPGSASSRDSIRSRKQTLLEIELLPGLDPSRCHAPTSLISERAQTVFCVLLPLDFAAPNSHKLFLSQQHPELKSDPDFTPAQGAAGLIQWYLYPVLNFLWVIIRKLLAYLAGDTYRSTTTRRSDGILRIECYCGHVRGYIKDTRPSVDLCRCRECRSITGGVLGHYLTVHDRDIGFEIGGVKKYRFYQTSDHDRHPPMSTNRMTLCRCRECAAPLIIAVDNNPYVRVFVGAIVYDDSPDSHRPNSKDK
ncbi:hypothetical protein GGR54DRAFT_641021 [Hypoxylon sp. NC1633]|nr:hypothetical protein GGR54DRAFT_641021 [Hypoxylon sp. NC1633]